MDAYSGEDIVISGIDGIFPKSKNIEEFGRNLYNKVKVHGFHIHKIIKICFKNQFEDRFNDWRGNSMDAFGLCYVTEAKIFYWWIGEIWFRAV